MQALPCTCPAPPARCCRFFIVAEGAGKPTIVMPPWRLTTVSARQTSSFCCCRATPTCAVAARSGTAAGPRSPHRPVPYSGQPMHRACLLAQSRRYRHADERPIYARAVGLPRQPALLWLGPGSSSSRSQIEVLVRAGVLGRRRTTKRKRGCFYHSYHCSRFFSVLVLINSKFLIPHPGPVFALRKKGKDTNPVSSISWLLFIARNHANTPLAERLLVPINHLLRANSTYNLTYLLRPTMFN